MKLSDFAKPASVQVSQSQFTQRVDRVLLHNASRGKRLEADFSADAEGAMTVAMCKLEVCRRDQAAGGNGHVPRIMYPPPAPGPVSFTTGGVVVTDERTTFDPPPPEPLPAAGWTLLSNRDLVNRAILDWSTPNHIGTNLDTWQAAALLGGHFALLVAAWGLGIGIFAFFAALLWGYGMDDIVVSVILFMVGPTGLGALVGLVYGMVKTATCHESGDHDMAMMGLFPIICRYGGFLDEKSYDHILHGLLRKHVSGGAEKVHEVVHVCGTKILLPSIGETENHILMIETARFLTNQLLLLPNPHSANPIPPLYNPSWDNSKNGMREWMLKHLQKYLQNDFWEFNSRIYARLVPLALQNLYEFSSDPDVSKAARMVLDYLSAKFAVTSNGSRRASPFRRTPGNRGVTGLFEGTGPKQSDAESWRFLVLSGDALMLGQIPAASEELVLDAQAYTLVTAGLGKYRVPGLILDLMVVKSSNRYLQLIRHGQWAHDYGRPALEITFNSGTYLITGGGLFAKGRGATEDTKEHAWALPTTLMPTFPGWDADGNRRSTDWRDFIRIEGTADDQQRANSGVAPGFACGLNPVVPDWMLMPVGPMYLDRVGPHWTFINCTIGGRPFGFYVAVYRAACDTERSKELAGAGGTFGFFAVLEAIRPLYNFPNFVTDVLALNASKAYSAEGVRSFAFPSGQGPVIEFECLPTSAGDYDRMKWPIVSVNGEVFERDIRKWDLANSAVYDLAGIRTSLEDWIIRSDDHFGCVMVDNPKLDERLVLDLSDALKPKSAYVKGQRFTSGCRCPLSSECERRHPIK